MEQLLCHLVGDYVLQSERMACNKSHNTRMCALHSVLYSLPFFTIAHNFSQVFVIALSHFILDRFSLTKYFMKFRNIYIDCEIDICELTGMRSDRLESIKWFVYIVTDNMFHLLCNFFVLKYL